MIILEKSFKPCFKLKYPNMNTNKIITVVIVFCAIATSSMLSAQEEYPEPGQMEANMSEFWLPQPEIVTPGVIACDEVASLELALWLDHY